MLNPKLNFNECLDHVKSGEGLEHLDREPLIRQKEAVLGLEELLRALVLADSPYIVRGEVRGMYGTHVFREDKGDFYLGNWVISPEIIRREVFGVFSSYLERMAVATRGPLVSYLQEPDITDVEFHKPSPLYYRRLKDSVFYALHEYSRNAAVHGSSSSSLWVSSKGLLVSSEQEPLFDIHGEYTRRMALPPDFDPLGREIPRPQYWQAFRGPGESARKGFVRGKGLGVLAQTEEVEVHTEFLPEDDDNDARTRFFMFSREPFKT